MTVQQIQERLSPHKRVSRPQLYRYLKVCRIKPIGLRQKPQQYPDDAPQRILVKLGFAIVSMKQLREARKRSKGGGR